MKVQVTEIHFDLDTLDLISQADLQQSLQEQHIGQVYNLDLPNDCLDEVVCDALFEKVAEESGYLIRSINYRYILF